MTGIAWIFGGSDAAGGLAALVVSFVAAFFFVHLYSWTHGRVPSLIPFRKGLRLDQPSELEDQGYNQEVVHLTAAQLLDEQELREALRTAERLLHLSNDARVGIEVISNEIIDEAGARIPKDLRFFVRLGLAGHRARYEAARNTALSGIGSRSLPQICAGLRDIDVIYHQEQGIVGTLASVLDIYPPKLPGYPDWIERETAYVTCAKQAAQQPLLDNGLISPIPEEFEKRDLDASSVRDRTCPAR